VGLLDTILKATHPGIIYAILVSDWLLFKKIFSSETAWQNGAKLGRKHLCKILYKASSFGSIQPKNIHFGQVVSEEKIKI
jgi:hypothetical protein